MGDKSKVETVIGQLTELKMLYTKFEHKDLADIYVQNLDYAIQILKKHLSQNKQAYDDLAQKYQDECRGGEYDYCYPEHLSEFLQKYCLIK